MATEIEVLEAREAKINTELAEIAARKAALLAEQEVARANALKADGILKAHGAMLFTEFTDAGIDPARYSIRFTPSKTSETGFTHSLEGPPPPPVMPKPKKAAKPAGENGNGNGNGNRAKARTQILKTQDGTVVNASDVTRAQGAEDGAWGAGSPHRYLAVHFPDIDDTLIHEDENGNVTECIYAALKTKRAVA